MAYIPFKALQEAWCPVCDEVRNRKQLILVPKDDLGNASFVGCRICNGRTRELEKEATA